MWDVKTVKWLGFWMGINQFYLNYVGCKVSNSHPSFTIFVSFTLTMWDVKQMAEIEFEVNKKFYLNYVGCKVA